MAYTKIHAIKATVDKAIEYICNPDKTDEQIYVSSYACAPETAAISLNNQKAMFSNPCLILLGILSVTAKRFIIKKK